MVEPREGFLRWPCPGSVSDRAAGSVAPAPGRLGQVCPRLFTLFGLDFESSQTDSDLAFLSGTTVAAAGTPPSALL